MLQEQNTLSRIKLNSVAEALFIACRMEESAISLYQRALMICPPAMQPMIEGILADEKGHLCSFGSYHSDGELSSERMIALSAYAEQLLYAGGLMGAARSGLLESPESLLRLAAHAEADSVQQYRSFADMAPGEVREVLLRIAQEEEQHHADLLAQLAALSGTP